MDDEIWKVANDDILQGKFEVSTHGRVRSKKTKKILKLNKMGSGYYQFTCKPDGIKTVGRRVHRLVMMTFVENVEDKPFVNHIDGDKSNNCIDNLEWCTQEENVKHSWETGLSKKVVGVDNHKSKLTDDDVRYIRENYIPNSKTCSQRALAKKFGVTKTVISSILDNKTWTHVE